MFKITSVILATAATFATTAAQPALAGKPAYYRPHRNVIEYYGRIAAERFCNVLNETHTKNELVKLYASSPFEQLNYNELAHLVEEIQSSNLHYMTRDERQEYFDAGVMYGLANYDVCEDAR